MVVQLTTLAAHFTASGTLTYTEQPKAAAHFGSAVDTYCAWTARSNRMR